MILVPSLQDIHHPEFVFPQSSFEPRDLDLPDVCALIDLSLFVKKRHQKQWIFLLRLGCPLLSQPSHLLHKRGGGRSGEHWHYLPPLQRRDFKGISIQSYQQAGQLRYWSEKVGTILSFLIIADFSFLITIANIFVFPSSFLLSFKLLPSVPPALRHPAGVVQVEPPQHPRHPRCHFLPIKRCPLCQGCRWGSLREFWKAHQGPTRRNLLKVDHLSHEEIRWAFFYFLFVVLFGVLFFFKSWTEDVFCVFLS